MKKVSIGLVGCGAIGSQLAFGIQTRFRDKARLVGIYDRNPKKAHRLAARFRPPLQVVAPKRLLPRCQLLIEAASPQAVGELLPQAISHRRALMVMSAGGLLIHRRLLKKVLDLRIPLFCPSGALAGLDGIKAGAMGKLRSVTLTTRKPPHAFAGAPEIRRRGIRLAALRSPRLLFEGTARAAVAAFPENINVAATLSLAGKGTARTRVRILADPTIQRNIHEVEAEGDFGKLVVRTENRPSGENRKTSQLAALSALATLRGILQPLQVGT